MNVLLAYILFTNVIQNFSYETECPNKSQWYLRSTAICNSSGLFNVYGCLFDNIHNIYAERCLKTPSVERMGRKNVFSGGIDRVPCESSRFQPFIFSTNGNDNCVYAKSLCTLEGQVIFDDGESNIDRSCRCDYINGYTFVHEPAEKCKCYPFIEDCTCYKKHCPPDSVLSPDYNCIPVKYWKGLIKCPQIDATNTKKEEKNTDIKQVFQKENKWGTRYSMSVYTSIVILMCLSCFGVLILYINKKQIFSFPVIDTNSNMSKIIKTIETTTSVEEETSNYLYEVDNKASNARGNILKPDSNVYLLQAASAEEENSNCSCQRDTMASNAREINPKPDSYVHSFHEDSNLKLLKITEDFKQNIRNFLSPSFDIYMSQRKQTMNRWRDQSHFFVKTSTYDKVLECARKYNCILVTGDDGNGISSVMQNVILFFENEDYEVYPITTPEYIEKVYSPLKKILFFVENICGRYDCVYYDIQLWSSWEIYIKRMLDENNVKLIVSCRHRVLKDSQFQKLKLYHSCICNLADEKYKYSENDIRKIADTYYIQRLNNMYQVYKKSECFPLLCSLFNNIKKFNHGMSAKDFFINPYSAYERQLNELINNKDFSKYCALALCVIFNNHLEEALFIGEISDEIRLVFTDTCEACFIPTAISRLVLRSALESLQDIFLKKQNGVYSTVHDKLFDFLVFFIGHRIIKCIIKHAQICVIMQRFIFKEYMAKSNEYSILIPSNMLPLYFDRLMHDWFDRELISVFSNKNFIDENFQETFIHYIIDQRNERHNFHLANVIAIEIKETPLTMSCSKGYFKLVRWLIKNEADVNECRYDGASPILLACIEGNLDVVTELLNAGADIYLYDIDGKTPLLSACQFNHYAIVQLLLHNDVDPNSYSHKDISPLMISSENGNIDVVSNLLEKFADVNYCTRSGVSALFLACEKGHTAVAKCLLEGGADINLCIKDGSSLLYIACQNGHLSTANTLLDAKIDINKSSYSGATPLFIACQEGYTEIVKTLIMHNANVNLFRYVSPLFTACEHGHLDVVKLLLQTDINVNKCNFKTLTPLYISCLQGNAKIVVELLKTNIDINMCSAEGKSPLFIACQQNQLDVVCHLLDMKEKLDINKCTIDKHSPLFEACLRGYIEIVKVLLENGADINIFNNEGHSAFSVAPENKRYSIGRLLHEKMNIQTAAQIE